MQFQTSRHVILHYVEEEIIGPALERRTVLLPGSLIPLMPHEVEIAVCMRRYGPYASAHAASVALDALVRSYKEQGYAHRPEVFGELLVHDDRRLLLRKTSEETLDRLVRRDGAWHNGRARILETAPKQS